MLAEHQTFLEPVSQKQRLNDQQVQPQKAGKVKGQGCKFAQLLQDRDCFLRVAFQEDFFGAYYTGLQEFGVDLLAGEDEVLAN